MRSGNAAPREWRAVEDPAGSSGAALAPDPIQDAGPTRREGARQQVGEAAPQHSLEEVSTEALNERAAAIDPVVTTVGAVRAVTTVGLLQLSVLVVMLLRSKVLALLLRPEGLGIVSTLDQLAQFVAQVSALSLIASPTRFIARVVVQGVQAVTGMYSALLKLLLLSILIGTLAAAGLVLAQPHILGPGLQGYSGIAVIAVLTAPWLALSGFFANVSAATKGYSTTSVYLLVMALVSLATAFIGLRANGIAGLYYATLVGMALTVLLFVVYLHLRVPLRFHARASRLRDEIRRHPDIVAYCSTTYVLSFAQPLAFLVVRSVVLDRLGSAEAGYFQAAFMISSIASIILTQAIRVYLEPMVNKATDDRLRIAAANEFERTFVVLILAGTLPLVLFPREIITMLFSAAFSPVSVVVFVFVLADLLFLCCQVYATVLMAVDDFKGFFQAHLAGHVCLCLGVWFFTGPYGLAGVAWSFVVSRLVVLVLIQGLLHRRHAMQMSARSAGLVAYSLAVVAVTPMIVGHDAVGTVAGVAIRLLTYAVAIGATVGFLRPDERLWLVAACRRALQYPMARAGRV